MYCSDLEVNDTGHSSETSLAGGRSTMFEEEVCKLRLHQNCCPSSKRRQRRPDVAELPLHRENRQCRVAHARCGAQADRKEPEQHPRNALRKMSHLCGGANVRLRIDGVQTPNRMRQDQSPRQAQEAHQMSLCVSSSESCDRLSAFKCEDAAWKKASRLSDGELEEPEKTKSQARAAQAHVGALGCPPCALMTPHRDACTFPVAKASDAKAVATCHCSAMAPP